MKDSLGVRPDRQDPPDPRREQIGQDNRVIFIDPPGVGERVLDFVGKRLKALSDVFPKTHA